MSMRNRTLIFLFLAVSIVISIYGQNHYVFLYENDDETIKRTYLLDVNDYTNPNFTYLLSHLKGYMKSTTRYLYYSPFSQSAPTPLSLPNDSLSLTTLWKSEEKNSFAFNPLSIYKNLFVISDQFNNYKYAYSPIQKFKLSNLTKIDTTNPDTLFRNLTFKKTIDITADGKKGYILSKGFLHTFDITDQIPNSLYKTDNIEGNISSIHSFGNNKVLYIRNKLLSFAEMDGYSIKSKYKIKIEDYDGFQTTGIEGVWPNPADNTTIAVIVNAIRYEKEIQLICIGTINLDKKTLFLNNIPTQKFIQEKVFITCKWSPDGQYLATILSLKQIAVEKGIGQIAILPFDMLNQTVSKTPAINKKYSAKISTDILWTKDSRRIFFIEKQKKYEVLSSVSNEMSGYRTWKLYTESNKQITDISGITSTLHHTRKTRSDSLMSIYLSGQYNTHASLFKLSIPVTLKRPVPFAMELPTDVFNNKLASIDEVIAFEKIMLTDTLPSVDGTINIINSLKDIPIAIASPELRIAFKEYCRSYIKKLVPDKSKLGNHNYGTMTLEDLKNARKAVLDFSTNNKNSFEQFINTRKRYLKNIAKLENQIIELKAQPASSCIPVNMLISSIYTQASSEISQGKSLSSIRKNVSDVIKSLKKMYEPYAYFSEYEKQYQSTQESIKNIMLSATDLNKSAVNYATYLQNWDSTVIRSSQEFEYSCLSKAYSALGTDVPSISTSDTTIKKTGLKKRHVPMSLDAAVDHYSKIGSPGYFNQAEKKFANKGTDGLNKYFKFNFKRFNSTAVSGILVGVAGIAFKAVGNNELDKYNNEEEFVKDIERYKHKTNATYAMSYISGIVSSGLLSYSTYYLIKHIIKTKHIKSKLSYNYKSSRIALRF